MAQPATDIIDLTESDHEAKTHAATQRPRPSAFIQHGTPTSSTRASSHTPDHYQRAVTKFLNENLRAVSYANQLQFRRSVSALCPSATLRSTVAGRGVSVTVGANKDWRKLYDLCKRFDWQFQREPEYQIRLSRIRRQVPSSSGLQSPRASQPFSSSVANRPTEHAMEEMRAEIGAHIGVLNSLDSETRRRVHLIMEGARGKTRAGGSFLEKVDPHDIQYLYNLIQDQRTRQSGSAPRAIPPQPIRSPANGHPPEMPPRNGPTSAPAHQARQTDNLPIPEQAELRRAIFSASAEQMQAALFELCEISPALSRAVMRCLAPQSRFAQSTLSQPSRSSSSNAPAVVKSEPRPSATPAAKQFVKPPSVDEEDSEDDLYGDGDSNRAPPPATHVKPEPSTGSPWRAPDYTPTPGPSHA